MKATLTLNIKICMAGDSSVGKTSLIRKYVLDIFDDRHLVTLGTKVTKKQITMRHPRENVDVYLTLLIWDIMGQIGFRPLLHEEYFRGARGAFIVCDMTRKETLETLDMWVESVFQGADGKVPLVFLVNKCDLKESARVSEQDISVIATRYAASYLFTSARTGENVERAFLELSRLILSS